MNGVWKLYSIVWMIVMPQVAYVVIDRSQENIWLSNYDHDDC